MIRNRLSISAAFSIFGCQLSIHTRDLSLFRKLFWVSCGLIMKRDSPANFMKFSRFLLLFVGLGCIPGVVPASFAQAPGILPQQFAGWEMQGTSQTSTDAASADPAN